MEAERLGVTGRGGARLGAGARGRVGHCSLVKGEKGRQTEKGKRERKRGDGGGRVPASAASTQG